MICLQTWQALLLTFVAGMGVLAMLLMLVALRLWQKSEQAAKARSDNQKFPFEVAHD